MLFPLNKWSHPQNGWMDDSVTGAIFCWDAGIHSTQPSQYYGYSLAIECRLQYISCTIDMYRCTLVIAVDYMFEWVHSPILVLNTTTNGCALK